MTNNLHGPKKIQSSGFSAAQWRDAHVQVKETNDTFIYWALYAAIGLAILGVLGLYGANYMKNKPDKKQMVVEETPDLRSAILKTQRGRKAAQKAVAATSQPHAEVDLIKVEIDKYNDTNMVLRLCGKNYAHISSNYHKQNSAKYLKLYDMQRAAWRQKSKNAEPSDLAKSIGRINKIENGGDVAKFMLTGGAVRHMNASMGFMADMQKMQAEHDAKDKHRKQLQTSAHDPIYCGKFATKVQTGQMNLKIPKI